MMGIVNGTTNYILSRMSEEKIAIRRCAPRRRSRLDTPKPIRPPTSEASTLPCRKPRSSPDIVFNAEIVNATTSTREGIEHIEVFDIEFAQRLGYEVKLLAIAEQPIGETTATPSDLGARHPAMVPIEHPLAARARRPVQRRLRRRRIFGRADVLWPRRRRLSDR